MLPCSGVTEGVRWKKHQNEITHLVLPRFNFGPVIEKCCYLLISTSFQNNLQQVIQI